MATVNDFIPTDDFHDVLAKWIEDLIPSTLRSEYKNVEVLSADRQLLDVDTPIQNYDCNGSNRDVFAPEPDAVENHLFFVFNGSDGGEIITVRDYDDTVTLVEVAEGDGVLLVPVGDGSYFVIQTVVIDTSAFVTLTGTQTLTNKRITERVVTVTVAAEPAINTDNGDIFRIGTSGDLIDLNITSLTTNLTGTPTHGQKIIIEYLDDGTPRTISHGSSFRAGTTTPLATTTVANKLMRERFTWDSADSKWDKLANWVES